MHIFGLTGGIASGKSTVTRLLRERGFEVVDLDELAREAVAPGTRAYHAIVREWPDVVLGDGSGALDRKALGAVVFSDEVARRKLNALTHRAILWLLLARVEMHAARGTRVLFIDAPLLFEAGLHRACERTWVVRCNEETQRARLMRRDAVSAAGADGRMRAQMPLAAKLAMPNVVVLDNDGSIEDLRRAVDDAVHRYAMDPSWTVRAQMLASAGLVLRLAHAAFAAVCWMRGVFSR